jgi:ADP-ribose pyrophosphatase YjhB (NUDIX family)
MAIPEFVLALWAKVGHDPLPLPGVTAVVFDDQDQVLLVRRFDNGRWTLITGCLELGEQPAVGALREIAEETGVQATVERLVSVEALDLTVCPNGDKVHWLDTTFRCRATGGQARVNDDESLEVAWFPVGATPTLPPRHARCLAEALDPTAGPRFATSAVSGST